MSKVLERATAHFRNRIGGDMLKINVPEWECDIWFKSVNTLKEEAKLIELASQGKQVEALVETLIMKARNQDGTKMFTMPDKMTFMNEVDPQIIIRIVGEMNQVANEHLDSVTVEKKLKADPDLLFAYRLAKDLGLLVEQVLNMSTAEFAGWAAFYKMEAEETKKMMNKSRSR